MDESRFRELSPQQYIRELFGETNDGKLNITYFPYNGEPPYTISYNMDWTEKETEKMVKRYDELAGALRRIGLLHDQLENEMSRDELLTVEDIDVWNTYIAPFEPFEVDESVVNELYYRGEYDQLDEEENELLERHYKWFEDNCLQRLPFNRCSPVEIISRARRYEKLVSLNAPEIVIAEEGRCLVQAMVLYYHRVEPHRYNLERFAKAQEGTYLKAFEEIKKGRKKTHWMWFIFPQLRGLGKSDMAYIYGIADLGEAEAYLNHIILKSRLVKISGELLNIKHNNPELIFGKTDAMKLQSSMTLFALISADDSVFHRVLQKFFNGKMDSRTLAILKEKM